RDFVAALNFEPTTDEEIHCRAIGVLTERTHQTVSEAERYLDQATDRSAGPSSGYKEKVIFFKRRGKTMAKPGFSDDALLNSYELFSNELAQVRNCASRPRTISPGALRKLFIGTELFHAADDEDWKKWIEDFASGATAKGAALVFLESKTGRKRRSI